MNFNPLFTIEVSTINSASDKKDLRNYVANLAIK
jgi:hypothetical protein